MDWLYWSVACLVCVFVLIAVHETGHFLAGWSGGIPARDMRLRLLSFPQHVALRAHDKWVSPADFEPYLAKMRACLPTSPRQFLYTAGGFLLETAFAVGAVGIALALGYRWPAQVVALCSAWLLGSYVLFMDLPFTLRHRVPWGDLSGLWWVAPGTAIVVGLALFIVRGLLLWISFSEPLDFLESQEGAAHANGASDEAVRALKSRIDVLTLTITIRPPKEAHDLRSVVLHTSPRITFEPAAKWPNGKPVSAHAKITTEQAAELIEVVKAHGFFDVAGKYYSTRQAVDPKEFPPPAGALAYGTARLADSQEPGYNLRLTVFDEYWYTTFEAALRLSTESRATLHQLTVALDGTALELLRKLEEQLK